MSEQPPYPSPVGFRWQKSWFGLGDWELVEDSAYPAPPLGFRYQADFHTGKPTLVPTHSTEIGAVEGLGSAGADRNSVNTPNYGPPSREYSFKTPDPSKITLGLGVDGIKNDPSLFVRVNGDPPKLRDKNGPAIFG